jgi:hypothetical protein
MTPASVTLSPLSQRLSRKQRALASLVAQSQGGAVGLFISLATAWVRLSPAPFQSAPTRFPNASLLYALPVILAMASASVAAVTGSAIVISLFYAVTRFFTTRAYESSLAHYTFAALICLPLIWLAMRLAERWVRR